MTEILEEGPDRLVWRATYPPREREYLGRFAIAALATTMPIAWFLATREGSIWRLATLLVGTLMLVVPARVSARRWSVASRVMSLSPTRITLDMTTRDGEVRRTIDLDPRDVVRYEELGDEAAVFITRDGRAQRDSFGDVYPEREQRAALERFLPPDVVWLVRWKA